MTDPRLEWGAHHALSFDYDVRCWIPVPAPGQADVSSWAKDTAKAWADDLSRSKDKTWIKAFRAICERAAGQTYTDPPDALFLHMRTPSFLPPSAAIATVTTWPADGKGAEDLAAELADSYVPSAARTPILEETVLADGTPAWLLTVYVHGAGEALELRQHLIWQIHEYMLVGLTMSGGEVGRILDATGDLLAFAAATTLVETGA